MRTVSKYLMLAFLLVVAFPGPGRAQTVDEILSKMMARNAWQDTALVEFRAQRKFYAANVRFKANSTMYVETVFKQPDHLESVVKSHEGSTFIRYRVFDKILEAETETSARKDKQQVDIIPANYNFSLEGSEDCDGRACYRMRISPKRRDKYSLDGEIWIDAVDYSIVRMRGSPAKRPSIWTLKTEIDRHYRKIGDVWLPDRMDSSSDIMVAGHSVLSIEYKYDTVRTTQ